jgi:hypothetical protein
VVQPQGRKSAAPHRTMTPQHCASSTGEALFLCRHKAKAHEGSNGDADNILENKTPAKHNRARGITQCYSMHMACTQHARSMRTVRAPHDLMLTPKTYTAQAAYVCMCVTHTKCVIVANGLRTSCTF